MKTYVTYLSEVSIIFLMGVIFMNLTICYAQSPWTQKADMSTTRRGHSSCILNGKIYVLGGGNSEGTTLSSMLVYDPILNSWTSKADMAERRIIFSACVFNGKILAIGGSHAGKSDPITAIEEYDPVSDTWSHKADMPIARLGLTAAVLDGKIYIIGGCTEDFTAIAEVDVYDPMTGNWTTAADLKTPRWWSASVVLNGKIYVLGGECCSPWPGLHTVEEYNPETDTWSSKANMITQRKHPAACVLDSMIYVFGGTTGNCSGILSSVEAYDALADTWTECTHMPAGMGKTGLSATVLDGKAYISGGTLVPCVQSSITSTMYEYDSHFDLYPLVEDFHVDKNTINASADTVVISARFNDPLGISVMARLYTLDGFPMDSLQLYDDGNHGDGAAGDSVYANYWKTGSGEEMQYYMDLKVTKIGVDTVIQSFNNIVIMTTDELVTTVDFAFKDSTCGSLLGNCIWTTLTLQNNSTQYAAKNIKAKLESLDSLVWVFNPFRYYDSIPSGDYTTPESIQIVIFDDFSDTIVPIAVHISSYDSVFRSDTFSIVVTPNTKVNDRKAPIVKIYPNPANDFITIETIEPGQHSIKITSLNGQTLFIQTMEGPSHQINLSFFQKGLYFITIRSRDYVSTEKIIKL